MSSHDPTRLDKVLKRLRVDGESPANAVEEFLHQGIPIHMGGVTDPFSSIERRFGVTFETLSVLKKHEYPVIISTSSPLFANDKYIDVLQGGPFILQVSLICGPGSKLNILRAPDSDSSALLRATERAVRKGLTVTCRLQPIIPGFEQEALKVISCASNVGIGHITTEYLKLPIERRIIQQRLSNHLGVDLREYYRDIKSTRVGREWILPLHYRLPHLLSIKRHALERRLLLSFADNDLLHYNKGNCCFGELPVDRRFANEFRFNYTEAIRRSMNVDTISTVQLNDAWRPNRSVRQFINSHSRENSSKQLVTIEDFVMCNWDGSSNGASPLSFDGIIDSGSRDSRGRRIYQCRPGLREDIERSWQA